MPAHRLSQGVLAVCLLIVCQLGFTKPRDPAPIPDEVFQKLVAGRSAEARDELAESVSAQVAETGELAREFTTELYRDAAAAGKGGRASAAEGKQAQLVGKRSEWLNWRGEVQRRIGQARMELLEHGLTDQAETWARHAAQLEKRFRDLDDAFERLNRSANRWERRQAAVALKSLLRGLTPRSAAGQLPMGSQQVHTVTLPPDPTPQQETDEVPQYLSDQRRVAGNMYAFAGDLLLAAAPVTPPEAASCSYTAADLAATVDAPQTAEIQDLAKSLDYSPRKIYQYVYNEIAFEPYYGSLKGAQGTLLAKAGGSTDQASLLIALLRASNIPARYVKGQIWVLDPAPAPVDGRGPRWVGAKSYTAAGRILATGYNPVAGAISTGLGPGITATQVWVEACVPYGHYRGVPLDNAGHRWIPMDPSFKDMRYQPGIASNVTFDTAGYLALRTFELPHEWYEQQVEAAIKGANPAAMLWDAPYRGAIEPRPLDILPASLPYLVVGFRSWAGTSSPETAELPASHRYQLDVNVNGTAMTTGTLALPQVALSRVSLSFKGATAADQTAFDAWRNDGNLGSALPCGNVVHVTPVVKVDGVEQAPAATPGAVDVCSTNNTLTLTVSLPELTNPVANIAPFNTIAAANIDVLAFYARQSSDALLTTRVVRLLNAVTANPDPNGNLEETEGELLNLIGLKYFRHVADSRQYIAGLDGGSGDSGPMLGRVSSGSKVTYLFDLPFAVVRSVFLVDIPSALDSNLDLTSGQLVWKTFQETGYQDSSLEHYIWQENLRMEAISTIRGLQVANETGIGTVQVDASNWATVRPLLSVYPGASASDCTYSPASLQYPRCIIDDSGRLNSTAYLVSLGYTVTLPVSLLQYGSYKGWVQMAERQTANAADTGMCAIAPFCSKFLISTNYSGGYTTTTNPVGWNYDSVLGTGFQSGANTPSTLNPAGRPPVYVGGAGIGPGADVRNSWSASVASVGSGILGLRSGVNRVTGNYYQKETDLAIAGRGGLPFRFERSYNSRNAKDGPLGFGWTHSFNHSLKFYGVEAGLAKVGWIDGTGAQRFFSTASHVSGNINAGAVLTNPEGVYVRLERISGGVDNLKYRLTDHNGLVYVYESQTGPSSPPAAGSEPVARLLAIQDRNGNALTLSYNTGCGNFLCNVRDGLNRSLSFTYSAGRITQISDWAGRHWQYAYDANGNLQAAERPLEAADPVNHPATIYAYYTAADGPNLNHALKSYTQPKGNGVRFEYYANGRLFREYPFDATGSRTAEAVTYRYNDFRRETVTTNARGYSRTDRFDAWGNPLKSIDETGAVTQYGYDPAKPYNRLSETDPLGQVTSYAYDANGNVTLKTLPSKLTTLAVNDTIAYGSFTAFNQPQWVKDARGHYSVLKYDAKGNLTETIRLRAGAAAPAIPYTPVAADIVAWTVNGYDSYGNPTTVKRVRNFAGQIANPAGDSGPVITYGYNANSLYPVSVTRHGDRTGDGVADLPDDTASLVFDSLGRQTQGIDADWQRIDTEYDADSRIVRATDTFGKLRDLLYDLNGNRSQEKLNLTVSGTPTLADSQISGHDSSDRIDHRIDAGGNVTGYGYDSNGNLQTLTDPDGYVLTYDYDGADRLTGGGRWRRPHGVH